MGYTSANVNKSVLGRGDIVASSIVDVGLEVAPDETPERHANILGWSDYDEKSKNKLYAIELAAKVNENNNFHLR